MCANPGSDHSDLTEATLQTPTTRRLVRRAVFLTEEEDRILGENARRRYLPSKAEYLRMLIEKDSRGELLLIDQAALNIATAVGQAVGGFFGQLQAEVERGLYER